MRKVVVEGVRTACSGCTTEVVNNVLTPNTRVLSSIRQGCPLSPLMFALYLESLCPGILQSELAREYVMGDAEVKVLAFADDVEAFWANKKGVAQSLDVCRTFCEAAGAVIYIRKFKNLWHGDRVI